MLRCRRWTEQEFAASRDAWQALSKRSSANPLFMSCRWSQLWWQHHRTFLGAEARVYAITDEHGALVGIAPFYLHGARHLGVLRTRRLELIGTAWRIRGPVFSEYLDVVAADSCREAVVEALGTELGADPGWDELILSNVRPGSSAELLARWLAKSAHARQAESLLAWSLPLQGSFAGFVEALGSNTRRRLYHQRHKLPDAEYRRIARAGWHAALDRLDALLAERWGASEQDTVRKFHEELVHSLPEESVHISELRSGGKLVSVMLNLRDGGTEYYLQSGFDKAFARGLSPGYLHLGYAIEAACRDGIGRFDLMAGRGFHRDYKRDLAAVPEPLSTYHLVRQWPLRALFWTADRLRGRTDITSLESGRPPCT